MTRRNHVAKLTGRIFNKLPKSVKPIARAGLKKAPGRVAKGKERLNSGLNSFLFGKKGRK